LSGSDDGLPGGRISRRGLKSLIGLEETDAREPRLARAAVCAKLILAILAESLLGRLE
jgi:hypothetical protein